MARYGEPPQGEAPPSERSRFRHWGETGQREQATKGSAIMDVDTFYVGQGALAILRHLGEAIIVDAHLPSSDRELRGRVVSQLYRTLHGHDVTGLVLTGFDSDHSSPYGVDLILSEYAPSWVMYPRYYEETHSASEVRRIIDCHQRRYYGYRSFRRVPVRVDGVDSRFLNGLEGQFTYELFSPHFEDMDSSNNSSIVLKITAHGQDSFSYLVTGDTENSRWERINQIFGEKLRSEVLAAPHHGAEDAAHSGAVRSIRPDTVLISAGVANQYGHPHQRALQVYKKVANRVYSTNQNGGVSLWTSTRYGNLTTETLDG